MLAGVRSLVFIPGEPNFALFSRELSRSRLETKWRGERADDRRDIYDAPIIHAACRRAYACIMRLLHVVRGADARGCTKVRETRMRVCVYVCV